MLSQLQVGAFVYIAVELHTKQGTYGCMHRITHTRNACEHTKVYQFH